MKRKLTISLFCAVLCCALLLSACEKHASTETAPVVSATESVVLNGENSDTSPTQDASATPEASASPGASPTPETSPTPLEASPTPEVPTSPTTPEVSATPEPSPTLETSTTPEIPEAVEQTPWVIDWDPHAASSIYAALFGEASIGVYRDLVEAIETGAESSQCEDAQYFWDTLIMLQSQYPLYGVLLSEIAHDEQAGVITLVYSTDRAGREALITEFRERVQEIVGACVYEEYSQIERAAALHAYLSRYMTYDYDAAEAINADVSPYRAIMTGEGICQSFTGAYTYIALQIGIDAVPVSGATADFSLAHEWNMIIVDGQRYYTDLTFENGDGCGLRYFGMTGAQREAEGGFVEDMYNIGNSNELWGRDFPVADERFSRLWSAAYLEDFSYSDGHLTAHCLDMDYEPFTFEFSQ